jgi:hypothetical protein
MRYNTYGDSGPALVAAARFHMFLIGEEQMDRTGVDTRRFPRHDETVCAWLTFHYDSVQCGTLTEDVSADGARFSTLRTVNPGEHLLLHLQVDPIGIECKGKVCWNRNMPNGLSRFGVRFIDLSEDEREQLRRYLARRENHRQDRIILGQPG